MGSAKFQIMLLGMFITMCLLMQPHSALATFDHKLESAEVCATEGPCPKALLQSIRTDHGWPWPMRSTFEEMPREEEQRQNAEEAQLKAEEEDRMREEERLKTKTAEASLKAEEDMRLKAEEEALEEDRRKSREEEQRRSAAEERLRKAEEEARLKAEEEDQMKEVEKLKTETEEASRKAEEDMRRKAEEEEALEEDRRKSREEEQRKRAEEERRRKAEEEVRSNAEEEDRVHVNASMKTETENARLKAEEDMIAEEEALVEDRRRQPGEESQRKAKKESGPNRNKEARPTIEETGRKVVDVPPWQSEARLAEASACADSDPNCPDWGAQGRCGLYWTWMSAHCSKSCGICDQAASAKPPQPEAHLAEASTCVDSDHNCPDWGAQGQCGSNWTWMSVNCRKSCNACDQAAPQPTEAPYCVDSNDSKCLNGGQRSSITFHSEASSLTDNACSDSDTRCEGWSTKGQCSSNWEWMSSHCMKSCRSCDRDTFFFVGADDQCALRNGSATCWGKHGEAYRATMPNTTRSFRDLSVGERSVCAILFFSGSVNCWGDAASWSGYQSLVNVDKVQVGEHHMCVLQGTEVRCFGDDEAALPYGSPNHVPDNLPRADQLQCGRWHCCIRTKENKLVQCWGFFTFGEGDWKEGPVEVLNGGTSSTWSCAIISSGRKVKCFTFESADFATIQPPATMGAAEDVCTGYYFGCALLSAANSTTNKSNVQCWGGNPSNVQVLPSLGSVNKLACGQSQAVAMKTAANSVTFWGRIYEEMPNPLFH